MKGPSRCLRRPQLVVYRAAGRLREKGSAISLRVGVENRQGDVNAYSSTTITRMAHTQTNPASVYGA
ncbi:hypothetical protein GCM10010272_54010 [Streptomyces lateritius]|nr:hypothetical protein GCM10010272_54010 [Streptomyces lateritius]